jgi:hypothetical protein
MHDTLQQRLGDGVAPLVVDLVSVPSVDDGIVEVLSAAALRAGRLGPGLELRLPDGRALTVRDAAQMRAALIQA